MTIKANKTTVMTQLFVFIDGLKTWENPLLLGQNSVIFLPQKVRDITYFARDGSE